MCEVLLAELDLELDLFAELDPDSDLLLVGREATVLSVDDTFLVVETFAGVLVEED